MRPLACAIIAALGIGGANAEEEDARAAKVMWTAFECSNYAGMAGKVDEADRLFVVGYEAGQKFMKAVGAGTITADESKSIVPVGVASVVSGPSAEFVIGRVYESTRSEAYDNVVREDAMGLVLPPDQWVLDFELQQMIASNRYNQSNCELIR